MNKDMDKAIREEANKDIEEKPNAFTVFLKELFWTFVPGWYGIRNAFPIALFTYLVSQVFHSAVRALASGLFKIASNLPNGSAKYLHYEDTHEVLLFWFGWYALALYFDRKRERESLIHNAKKLLDTLSKFAR